ncbi:MAG: tRNA pseudouridine(54/55) synthase Pus10 [Thermoplasmata archaeon]|nr:tRNA pseudouridine(54/55) synthase Pus10 [Thermoplasmata archaeon]
MPEETAAPTFPIDAPVLESAGKAAALGLCPECFGRCFGQFGHGLTNPERAARLWAALDRPTPPAEGPCPLCEGLFDRWETWVTRTVAAAADCEWHRFSCGSRWDPELLAREEMIWTRVGSSWGESARGAFNRELGKRVEARSGAAGSPDDPEIVFLVDLPAGRVDVTRMPIYFGGRYRKLDRTLPQTRWPCRRCQGRGCETCGGTGKTYPTSVEELIGEPLLRASGGSATRFHGMGREDIDARMLGSGRPFVLEIRSPRTRSIDVADMALQIRDAAAGRVEVDGLRVCDAAEVLRVKEASPTKSYRVGVVGEVPLPKVNEALAFVAGRAIAQRTPTRVAHRRSDRVRSRRILSARLVEGGEGRFTLDLRAEAGTYIKEWVEGDGGRTEPNLSQLLGVPLTVEFLDVLEIHDSEK